MSVETQLGRIVRKEEEAWTPQREGKRKDRRKEDNRGKKVRNGREKEEQDKGKHVQMRNVQDNDYALAL